MMWPETDQHAFEVEHRKAIAFAGHKPENDGVKSPALRAFVAIHPPQEMLESISAFQRGLKSLLPASGMRWVNAKQIHLTLKFLGVVPADSIEDIASALKTICDRTPSLQISTGGLGVFPNLRRPQVLWAGLAGETKQLSALQSEVERAAATWSKPEAREFHPHLTLARIKELRAREIARLKKVLETHGGKKFGGWRVSSVHLMESRLSANGAEHFPLAQFALGSQCCAS